MRNVLQILKSTSAGFSLLEVSVALIVVGIMASIGLPMLSSQIQSSKFSKTHANQEYVMTSLASYLQRNKCLPGAADPKARGENYGKAMPPVYGRAAHSIGIVPFQTLGIAERYAKDGFGNYMTYAVKPHFAKSERINVSDVANGEAINLIKYIQGQAHQHLQSETDAIAVVLISHGQKGHGAYLVNGEQISVPSSNIDEAINANSNLQFVDKPYSVNQNDYFGHIVLWETIGNIGNRIGFSFKFTPTANVEMGAAVTADEQAGNLPHQGELLY